jgi:Domain of unknown function (DUF5753)/Helix-turn-helix domain
LLLLAKVMSDMANDHGPVVQSALLCLELARLRRDMGLGQDEAAASLAWTTARMIEIESGRPVAEADLEALLERYDVPAGQRERLRELNRGARDDRWWADYRPDVPAVYLDYIGYERGAVSIRQFPGTVVPGLLQTAAYAGALTSIAIHDPDRAARVVELRRRRQSELTRRDTPPRQHYILDEAVIRRRTGASSDREIMAEQLRYIAHAAGDGGLVTVQVIPFEAGEHAGLSGPFTLLELPGSLPGIVYLDSGRDPIEMSSRFDQFADSAGRFERLLSVALPAAESVEVIRAAAESVA